MTENRGELIRRLWQKDVSLWSEEPNEQTIIANRLGWLDTVQWLDHNVDHIVDWSRSINQCDWLDRVVLLGMGGSSMAPEVFASVFGNQPGCPSIEIIDTTSPEQIHAQTGDLTRTLFIVSSKSGTSKETLDLFEYFYDGVSQLIDSPGKRFVAITDPGSWLSQHAEALEFEKIFLNPPDIGGRYSALSYFGLVPAALIGVDIKAIALKVAAGFSSDSVERAIQPGAQPDNPIHEAIELGTLMGSEALRGNNIIRLQVSERLAPLTVWIEQLIAESTGKKGVGIIPVFNQADQPVAVGDDQENGEIQLTVTMSGKQSSTPSQAAQFQWSLRDVQDIGVDFFRWEIATAVAARHLNINPFDEPNVSQAKESTALFISGKKTLTFEPSYRGTDFHLGLGTTFSQKSDNRSIAQIYNDFDQQSSGKIYLGVLAYFPYSNAVDEGLGRLCQALQNRFGIPVTLGYGPRYLHSTGQLHKGGPTECCFVQLLEPHSMDLTIPNRPYTFGQLQHAQANGDFSVLNDAQRAVMRVLLTGDRLSSLETLIASLE